MLPRHICLAFCGKIMLLPQNTRRLNLRILQFCKTIGETVSSEFWLVNNPPTVRNMCCICTAQRVRALNIFISDFPKKSLFEQAMGIRLADI